VSTTLALIAYPEYTSIDLTVADGIIKKADVLIRCAARGGASGSCVRCQAGGGAGLCELEA